MERNIKISNIIEKTKKIKPSTTQKVEVLQWDDDTDITETQEKAQQQTTSSTQAQGEPQKVKLKPKTKTRQGTQVNTITTAAGTKEVGEVSKEAAPQLPKFLKPKGREKSTRITTYIEEGIYATLRKLKEEEEIQSIAPLINTAIKEYLEKYRLNIQ